MSERLTSVKQIDFTPRGPVFPSPRDWRDQVIYHLLIDRFDDGKEHPAYDPKSAKRGRDAGAACRFQGGTLKGVTRRLDYIKGLGATTVWISPPFKNRAEAGECYHGYGIQNFLEIDPRFGTTADLQELVREAHGRGMYVVLDIIINHVGDVWAYPDNFQPPYDPNGTRYNFGFWRKPGGGAIKHEDIGKVELSPEDAVWPVELQDPEVYKRRGSIRDFAGAGYHEKLDGDFIDLKDINLANPAALDVMIQCYKYWIAVADVDGYRMDTVTHTEPEQTAVFCNAIREYCKSIGKDDFIIFAEIVEPDEKLKMYVGGNLPASEERYPHFNACLDFPLYFVLEDVIKGRMSPQALHERYERFRLFYKDYSEVGRYFITFVDNHDQIGKGFRRFMAGEGDPNLAVLAVGYLLTNMGIPCIYYGTEQAFDGGGPSDVYVREAMFGGPWGAFDTQGVHFFDPQHPVYQGIARIAAVRQKERALRYGREYFREISGDGENFGHPIDGKCTLAFSRVLDTTEILVALNLETTPRNDYVIVDARLTPPGRPVMDLLNASARYEVTDVGNGLARVQIPLGPRQIAILKTVPQGG
jgi:glycosidase